MKPLRMIAMDAEDLAVISAHCQDAVMKAADLDYLAGEKRFVLAMNRFVWEDVEDRPDARKRGYERRRSVLHFERVEKVSMLDIHRTGRDQVLDLLAITFTEEKAPGGVVELSFAGGATLRLEVECIEAKLTDLGAAWETGSRPDHEEADSAS